MWFTLVSGPPFTSGLKSHDEPSFHSSRIFW